MHKRARSIDNQAVRRDRGIILHDLLATVDPVLTRITESHLSRYDQLQRSLRTTNVASDSRFQSTFNGHHRMQRRTPTGTRFFSLPERETHNKAIGSAMSVKKCTAPRIASSPRSLPTWSPPFAPSSPCTTSTFARTLPRRFPGHTSLPRDASRNSSASTLFSRRRRPILSKAPLSRSCARASTKHTGPTRTSPTSRSSTSCSGSSAKAPAVSVSVRPRGLWIPFWWPGPLPSRVHQPKRPCGPLCALCVLCGKIAFSPAVACVSTANTIGPLCALCVLCGKIVPSSALACVPMANTSGPPFAPFAVESLPQGRRMRINGKRKHAAPLRPLR